MCPLIGSIVGVQQRLDLHHEHTDAPPPEGVELVAQQEEEGVREEESGGEERADHRQHKVLTLQVRHVGIFEPHSGHIVRIL